MADQRITFTLGTVFKGEGFQQAKTQINNLNNNIKKSSAIATQMTGALAGMNNMAGKAAGAVSGLIGAFTSGGPILAAVSLAMLAVNKVLNDYNKAQEEAKKATEDYEASLKKLKETQDKIWSEKLKQSVDSTLERIKAVRNEYEIIVKNSNEMISAFDQMQKSKDTGNMIQMQYDKFQSTKKSNYTDDEAGRDQRAVDIARKNYEIEKEKSRKSIEAKNKSITDIDNQIVRNENQQKIARENAQNLQAQIEQLRAEYQNSKDSNRQKELMDSISKLGAQKESEIKRFQDLEQNKETLTVKRQTAQQELENQKTQNALNEGMSEEEVYSALDSQSKNEVSRKKKANDDEISKAINERREAEEQLTKQLKEELVEKEKVLEFYKKLIAPSTAVGGSGGSDQYNWTPNNNYGRSFDFGALNAMKKGVSQSDWVKNAVREAVKSGKISSLKDANDYEKQLNRDWRNTQSSNPMNQYKRDQRELERLQKMNPKAMSDYDKNKLKKLQEMDDWSQTGENATLNDVVNEIKGINEKIDSLTVK